MLNRNCCLAWLIAASWLMAGGSAIGQFPTTAPYSEDGYPAPPEQWMPHSEPAAIEIEYGKAYPVLDGTGWVFGIPRKVMLWNKRLDNHNISEQTVDQVATYLAEQNLTDVKVRVNQYAPRDEWRRLVANKQIAPGWKYTVGVLKHLEYAVLPGRVFGGDSYNPFTNSLYLYSDVPAMGMVESAYAKDIHAREFPGTYAVSQTLPIISMWHEAPATHEIIHYVALYGSPEEQAETRRLLYARYGMELGGELGGISGSNGLQIGGFYDVIGAAAGHAVAGIENARNAAASRKVGDMPSPAVVRGNR